MILSLSYSKNLTRVRRWDQLLKFNLNFNAHKNFGLNALRLSISVKSADDETSIVKALDFIQRSIIKSNLRVTSLFRSKKYNTSTPVEIFLFLRGYYLFQMFFFFSKLYNLASTRHTFISQGLVSSLVSFNFGNLNELFQNFNPIYDYSNWSPVLTFSFFTSGYSKFSQYFFSIFGFFYLNNTLSFNYETFNF